MILLEEFKWIGSSLTDWIQSIAALIAIPGAIVGFIFLFRKDKEKENQIKKLSDIAIKLEAQNIIMQEGNILMSNQGEVLRNVLISQTETKEGAKKLADIEEQKFLLSIRPRLFSNGGLLNNDKINFLIENFGEVAFIKSVKDVSGNNKLIMKSIFSTTLEVGKNNSFTISTNTASGKHWNAELINHRFEIQFTDKYGNLYMQEVYGTLGSEYSITDPKLIKRATT